MAAVVCELCGNYDTGAEVAGIILWAEEAELCGGNGNYKYRGDGDDFADYFVLFWADFASECSGEFIDTSYFAVGDGASILDWSSGWGARSGDGGGVVRNANAGFSYCGGGIFWWNGAVSDKDGNGEMAGVFDVYCDLATSDNLGMETTEKS